MNALEVTVNGKHVCTAGLPGSGVISCMLSGIRKDRRRSEDGPKPSGWTYDLSVGGLRTQGESLQEFPEWHRGELTLGDEVIIRLVEVEQADEPASRRTCTVPDLTERKRAQLANLKQQAADLSAELGEDG